MSILSKNKFFAQIRLDKEDIDFLMASIETDAKFWTEHFWGPGTAVLKGFTVSGLTSPSPVQVTLDNSTLINSSNSGCFSWFVGADGGTPIDVDLTAGVKNFLELSLSRADGTPLTRAFWDQSANSGDGSEFNQTVDTVSDLNVSVVAETGGFSGSVDRIPIAIVETDGTNTVTMILDKRNLFFRLGTANDPENNFAWNSQTEPFLTLNLSGISGTFTVGENITFSSSETAEVTGVNASSIEVILLSADTISPGVTISGDDSGASATVDSVESEFTGADKDIETIKDKINAITTELKAVKGTRFWFESASTSLASLRRFLDSTQVQDAVADNAHWAWSGTQLQITDDNGSPADGDEIANIRIMGEAFDFALTRQDGTGGSSSFTINDFEILFIKIPDNQSRTYTGVGWGW